jgi:hypothetical protein
MIYITSDLHGAFDINKINPDTFQAGNFLTRDDYLIVTGDFGCVWDGGSSDRFWLNWLKTLPWTTLFIDGNHENFDVLESYPEKEWHGGKVREICDNVLYLQRGEVFDLDGYSFLACGGGISHDTEYREQGKNWWSQEVYDQKDLDNTLENLKKHGNKVDYILSHDVYMSHPYANKYGFDREFYPPERLDQREVLETVRKNTDYKAWFCGHYHDDAVTKTDGKPCYLLFNNVLALPDLLNGSHSLKNV